LRALQRKSENTAAERCEPQRAEWLSLAANLYN
jgi:hypothetical protein